MLPLYSEFLLKQAIRSHLYLSSPLVTPQDEIIIPRFSVIHYFDSKNENHFPDRGLYYFKDVSNNKKIPIHHALDLVKKDGTTSLNNKHLLTDIRKWNQANIRQFRTRDLKELPNTDVSLVSVFNYNTIKDLYNYQTSLQVAFNRHNNLTETFWSGVKDSLVASQESIAIVPIELPTLLPSYIVINKLIRLTPVKLMRVVTDERLLWVLDIYQWLLDEFRSSTPLRDIKDEESHRVIIELKYKGYSSFLPLSVIRILSKESELKSSNKQPPEKIVKLFILALRRIQSKVSNLLETTQINNEPSYVQDETDLEEDEDNETSETKIQALTKTDEPSLQEVKKTIDKKDDGKELDDIELDDILKDAEDEDDTLIDSFFEEKLVSISQPAKLIQQNTTTIDVEEEPPSPIKNFSDEEKSRLLKSKGIKETTEEFIEKAIQNKTHTAAEIRGLRKLTETRNFLKNPYSENEILDKTIKEKPKDIPLTKETTSIPVKNELVTDNLKTDVIGNFDRKYITQLYKKDVLACVANLENAGVIIKDYEVEDVKTSTDNYETHKLTLKPLEGKESTIYFRIPKIDNEGTFKIGNIHYRMRKQRTDLPIRKISPIRVALTSNSSKLFISRTERKTNDPDAYLLKYIQTDYLNEGIRIKKLVPGAKRLNKQKLPNTYHLLATHYNEIQATNFTLLLNPNTVANHIEEKVAKDIESKGYLFCGYLSNKHILVMSKNSKIYDYTSGLTPVGDIETLLEMDKEKIPKPFSVMKVLGDDIPLGVCLSYYLGISGLLAITNTQYKVLGARQQYKPENNELVLRFIDHKLVLVTDTVEKKLLFNGFLFYKDFTKQHVLESFNDHNVYLDLVEFRGAGLIHLKELNSLRELFLDPITVDVLKEINEPTEFLELLMRANQLLEDYSHPDINDPNYSRIRGYDRVPGLMYRALVESIREYKIRNRSGSKISLDPYKVWNYITQDNTDKACEELNPILNLKEVEAVTLTGADGLSKDATPKELRRFHVNDTGLMSEATVDSSDVALNLYLCPYAKLKGVRGLINKDSTEHIDNKSKVFSSAVQLAPLSEYDDAKRVNFVNVQYSHTIPSDGYTQPIIRSNYEYVVPYKVGSNYAVMAKEDGSVISITEKLITIKYKSGLVEAHKLGVQYGRMEGSIYPHTLITDLSSNEKFKEGDPICYNPSFFERDWLDKTRILSKTTGVATVALTINNEVFEDSSAISRDLANKFSTSIVKEKSFIIDFKTNLLNLHPVGTKVDPNTILFTAIDEAGDYSNLSETSIAMLQNLASLSPRSKIDGIIDRYEIKYNGDLADMSPTLKKLASKLDKELYEATKGTEYEVDNNRVSSEYRSEGKNLNLDTLELKVFIRVGLRMVAGDKGAFANQMKSVVSDVFTYNVNTESGDTVEAFFSFRGVLNRIVTSPITMGCLMRTTRHVSKQAADIYFGN